MNDFKQYVLSVAVICLVLQSTGQKPSLDFSELESWPSILNAAISNNGKFVLFQVDNVPAGEHKLILHNNKSGSELQINNASFYDIKFTDDSKFLIGLVKDTLTMVSLTDLSLQLFSNVRSYKLSNSKMFKWICIKQEIGNNSELSILNLDNGFKKKFENVKDYFFTNEGDALLLQRDIDKNGDVKQKLDWIDLELQKEKTIWKGKAFTNIVFDKSGRHLAFSTPDETNANSSKTFWYYDASKELAVKLLDHNSLNAYFGFQLGDIKGFSKDAKSLFFNLAKPSKVEKGAIGKLNVWSYLDTKLQFTKSEEQKDYLL